MESRSTNEKLFLNQIEWMNSEEAAAYLRVSVSSLRMIVWRRRLKAYKQGRRLLFRKSDLDELIKPL